MTSRLVVDAVEQAVWTRGREGRGDKDLVGLIAHHDALDCDADALVVGR
jgi:putative transposase